MPVKHIWVVVADEAIARILHWPEVGDELLPLEELTDPDAHARGRDLRDDAEGRRTTSGTGGVAGDGRRLRGPSSVTASAGPDERHQEAQAFARRVAQHLGDALQQQRYGALHVVAAPRFLGLLRQLLPPAVQAVVAGTLDKELVHDTARELTARLFPRGNPHALPPPMPMK